jgi:transposase
MTSGKCPGSDSLRDLKITAKKCPVCGFEIEMFSNRAKSVCEKCGFIAYNDTMGCVKWCAYARACFGDEVYEKMTGKSALLTAKTVTMV